MFPGWLFQYFPASFFPLCSQADSFNNVSLLPSFHYVPRLTLSIMFPCFPLSIMFPGWLFQYFPASLFPLCSQVDSFNNVSLLPSFHCVSRLTLSIMFPCFPLSIMFPGWLFQYCFPAFLFPLCSQVDSFNNVSQVCSCFSASPFPSNFSSSFFPSFFLVPSIHRFSTSFLFSIMFTQFSHLITFTHTHKKKSFFFAPSVFLVLSFHKVFSASPPTSCFQIPSFHHVIVYLVHPFHTFSPGSFFPSCFLASISASCVSWFNFSMGHWTDLPALMLFDSPPSRLQPLHPDAFFPSCLPGSPWPSFFPSFFFFVQSLHLVFPGSLFPSCFLGSLNWFTCPYVNQTYQFPVDDHQISW